MRAYSVHQLATRTAILLGSGNPLVRFRLRAECRRYGAELNFLDGAIDVCKRGRAIRISSKHFVYAKDMARSFESYFAQVIPTETKGQLLVDYSHPRVQRYAKTGLEFELASFPEEAEAIEDYFRWYRPKQGDIVFDVGAYCGVSSYYFSNCVGADGKVYAFEPDPISYGLLRRNIDRHSLNNVVPLQLAIAGSSGELEFCSEGTLGSSLSRQMSRATVGSVERVPSMSFEDACRRYGVPSFAKIDIEGSEIEVLSSARSFLPRQSIHFVLDTNHWVNGVRTNAAVEALFADCNYVSESSDESGFMTTWARKRESEKDATG